MALDPDFDERVRVALDPDRRAVDRMVLTALERGKVASPRHRKTWRFCLAAAAVLVCALWVTWQPLLGPPSPVQPPAGGFAVTRAGEVVMIQSASGETWILGPRRAGDTRPAGTGFVIVEGDSK